MSRPPKIDRQREHQANERTFLAWLRTSISLIGFGFAITRFGIFVRQLEITVTPKIPRRHSFVNSENLGIALVVFGIVVIASALWSHDRSYWQIERGDYRPNRLMIWITTVVVIFLGILSLAFML
ncbi:MAG: YidH family protein [Pseudanabaena sp.]|jgi:putative membrane protein